MYVIEYLIVTEYNISKSKVWSGQAIRLFRIGPPTAGSQASSYLHEEAVNSGSSM